jgi:hypothetical protein
LYLPSDDEDPNAVIVGAVVSRVIVSDEVVATSGPVLEFTPSARVAPLALNLGTTVPSAVPVKHEDAVSVYTVVDTDDTE